MDEPSLRRRLTTSLAVISPAMMWPQRLLAAVCAAVLLIPLLWRDFVSDGIRSLGAPPEVRIYGGIPAGQGEGGTFQIQGIHLFVLAADPGVPARKDLQLQVLRDNGTVHKTLGPSTGERNWRLETGSWIGLTARLTLPDGSPARAGEHYTQVRSADHPAGVMLVEWPGRNNHLLFAYCILFVGVLIWMPGLVARAWIPARSGRLCGWWMPLPGFLLLSLSGLALWVGDSASSHAFARVYLGVHVLLAIAWALRPGRAVLAYPADRDSVLAYAGLSLASLAFSMVKLPVAHEAFTGYSLQGHVALSSGDHSIPFVTAAYFQTGRDGKEESERYFSKEWSVASRGPVPSWALVTLFNTTGAAPPDPLGPSSSAFPAASEAFFLARIWGVLTNALILFGSVRLLHALGRTDTGATRLALAWTLLAPTIFWNTIFVWPKLCAAYFVLLAVADVIEGRRRIATGMWCALGWLCHPVAALFIPAIGLLLMHREWKQGALQGRLLLTCIATRLASVALGGVIVIGPWLAYKAWVGAPDAFFDYPLGGGYGFVRAESVWMWLTCRWDNLVLTLIPALFFFTDTMTTWVGVPVTESARWLMQSQKTLPAELGFAALPLAVFALRRREGREAWRAFCWTVVFSLALMILYWGYSRDGLGRASLEPVTALVICLCVAMLGADLRGTWRWILLLAAETLILGLMNFTSAPTFDWGQMTGEVWAMFLASMAALLAPLFAWRDTLRSSVQGR